MKLTLHNHQTNVEFASQEEAEWLINFCAFKDSTNAYTFVNGELKYNYNNLRHMFNQFDRSFPTGLASLVLVHGKDRGFHFEVNDQRVCRGWVDENADLTWLRGYQQEAVWTCTKRTRGVLWLVTGSGKCLGRGTQVLMYGGSVRSVEDVCNGDLLTGPDGTPRRVIATSRGVGELFRINPLRGDPWICNDVHMLTLVHTQTHEIIDISLAEYLAKPKGFKHLHKQFSVPVDFAPVATHLPISPYFLGVWLGDGGKDVGLNGIRVSKPDREIYEACVQEAARFGLVVKTDNTKSCPTHRIVGERGGTAKSWIKEALISCFEPNSWRLRAHYRQGSRQTRLEILAGLLDTDGHCANNVYDLIQKNKEILDDAIFIARSLGLAACSPRKKEVNGAVYWRTTISGETDMLPLRIPRKRAQPRRQIKDALRTGFSVEPVGEGEYFGFTLDGDGRFLLGDFVVTHNTEIAIGITKAIQEVKWLFLAPEVRLVNQAADRYELRTGDVAGRIGDGEWSVGDVFTAATFQTLSARLKSNYAETSAFLRTFTGVMVDEFHGFSSEDCLSVGEELKEAYWRFGMSGTALDRGDRKDMLGTGLTGRVIYHKPAIELINDGYVAMPKVRFHRFEHTHAPQATAVVVGLVNIVRNAKRNALIAELTAQAEKPALVGVRTTQHGQSLVKLLRAHGIRTEFLHGKLSQEAQDKMIGRLKDLTTEVIVATKVLQTGTDIEEIATVVNARGNASVIETLQLVGRGMRIIRDANGKLLKGTVDVIEVYDAAVPAINPLTNRKVVQQELKWLEGYSKTRVASYKSMDYDVVVMDSTAPPVGGTQLLIPLPP